MGVITGVSGAVNGQNTVAGFRIQTFNRVGPYAASNTKSAMDVVAGWNDWKGSLRAYGHTPASMPGEDMAFIGSIDGSLGVTGTALVDTVVIDCEIPQEEEGTPRPIEHQIIFGGNGTLARGAASASDATVPNPPNARYLKVGLATPASGTETFTDDCQVYKARLVIGGGVRRTLRKGCNTNNTFRYAGNINAQLQYETYAENASQLPSEGDIKAVKLYVTSTSAWYIDWMICEACDPMEVEVEGRKLFYGAPKWTLKSVTEISSVATRGFIKKPGGAVFWNGT